jgi:hypothetical protein
MAWLDQQSIRECEDENENEEEGEERGSGECGSGENERVGE